MCGLKTKTRQMNTDRLHFAQNDTDYIVHYLEMSTMWQVFLADLWFKPFSERVVECPDFERFVLANRLSSRAK